MLEGQKQIQLHNAGLTSIDVLTAAFFSTSTASFPFTISFLCFYLYIFGASLLVVNGELVSYFLPPSFAPLKHYSVPFHRSLLNYKFYSIFLFFFYVIKLLLPPYTGGFPFLYTVVALIYLPLTCAYRFSLPCITTSILCYSELLLPFCFIIKVLLLLLLFSPVTYSSVTGIWLEIWLLEALFFSICPGFYVVGHSVMFCSPPTLHSFNSFFYLASFMLVMCSLILDQCFVAGHLVLFCAAAISYDLSIKFSNPFSFLCWLCALFFSFLF